MELDALLRIMVQKKASDLHLRAGSRPIVRIHEELTPLEEIGILTSSEVENLAFSVMTKEQKKIYQEELELDIGHSVSDVGRFRLNIFQQRGTIDIVLRMIPFDIPNFEDLHLPPVLATLADQPRGLVLVTGTTGSGKSTTLAAMIDYINSNKKTHIITVEDPIEFLHKDKMSIISQRELGCDTKSFSTALKYIMRQDPDVILIGEMRDLETMGAALTAAQLGHLVLSTLHTIDAISTVTRIIDMFPPHQQNQVRFQLSDTLKGVVSQRLLPLTAGDGLIPAVEVMVVTPYIRKLIAENKLSEASKAIQQGDYYGMQTFNQSLVNLYKSGKVTLDDAKESATSPEEFMLNVKGVYAGEDSTMNFENDKGKQK
ncbi:MAG: type IV pilus twitching motility protein PilT [bacterium]